MAKIPPRDPDRPDRPAQTQGGPIPDIPTTPPKKIPVSKQPPQKSPPASSPQGKRNPLHLGGLGVETPPVQQPPPSSKADPIVKAELTETRRALQGIRTCLTVLAWVFSLWFALVLFLAVRSFYYEGKAQQQIERMERELQSRQYLIDHPSR